MKSLQPYIESLLDKTNKKKLMGKESIAYDMIQAIYDKDSDKMNFKKAYKEFIDVVLKFAKPCEIPVECGGCKIHLYNPNKQTVVIEKGLRSGYYFFILNKGIRHLDKFVGRLVGDVRYMSELHIEDSGWTELFTIKFNGFKYDQEGFASVYQEKKEIQTWEIDFGVFSAIIKAIADNSKTFETWREYSRYGNTYEIGKFWEWWNEGINKNNG